MKCIIAGGRHYKFTENDYTKLDQLAAFYDITHVISGKCTGADTFGEIWAKSRDIPVIDMPADWVKFGIAAGPIRNEEMAKIADGCILFPGGSGTDNMYEVACKYELLIFDLRV